MIDIMGQDPASGFGLQGKDNLRRGESEMGDNEQMDQSGGGGI